MDQLPYDRRKRAAENAAPTIAGTTKLRSETARTGGESGESGLPAGYGNQPAIGTLSASHPHRQFAGRNRQQPAAHNFYERSFGSGRALSNTEGARPRRDGNRFPGSRQTTERTG